MTKTDEAIWGTIVAGDMTITILPNGVVRGDKEKFAAMWTTDGVIDASLASGDKEMENFMRIFVSKLLAATWINGDKP